VKVKQTGAVVVEDLDIRHPLFIRLLPYEPELGRIVHLRDTVTARFVWSCPNFQIRIVRMPH
jgi:hypothetical protein